MAIKTIFNTVEMKEIYHNTSRLDEMYMNGVIVYKRMLEIDLDQQSNTFNLRSYIDSKNSLGADVIVVTNNKIQPSMVSGNLSGLNVTFINNGEIQGTNEGDTALSVSTSMKLINNGWIRGAGGHGGTGGVGIKGANGSKGTNKTVTYSTYSTIPYMAIMTSGSGTLTCHDPACTVVPNGWLGFSVSASYRLIANNTLEGTFTATGPCGSKTVKRVSANGDSWREDYAFCGTSGIIFDSIFLLHFLPIALSHLTFPKGARYKSGTLSHVILGGAGGIGGAGGVGGAGGRGHSFKSSKSNGIGGGGGSPGTSGKRNTWTDPNGVKHYGNYGTAGSKGSSGGTGGAGGEWGLSGVRGYRCCSWGALGAYGTSAGKAISGTSFLSTDSLTNKINGALSTT